MPTRTWPLFAAAGYNGVRIVSDDGKTWRDRVLGREGEVYRALTFGDGRFLASGTIGGPGMHSVTSDGIVWRTISTPEAKDNGTGIKGNGFGFGRFITFGGDPGGGGIGGHNHQFSSADGLHWSAVTYPKSNRVLRRLAFGDKLMVGVGDAGRRSVSKDGENWEDAPDPVAKYTLVDIAFGNGLFVGVGLHSLRMTTADGLKWSAPQVGEEGEHLNSVVFCGDRFVAAGPDVTYSSPDGVSWKRLANHNGPLAMAFAEGIFVGSRWKGRLLYSSDAVEWTDAFQMDYHIEALAGAKAAT